MISAQCITYNRPELLEEAIESFLRQDYDGEMEMVILNDSVHQLEFNHPEVHIWNVPKRFRTIGEKRNACVSLCAGEVIFPWDDDDISLPWRISLSLKYKGRKRYFKNKRAWLWQNGSIKPEPVANTYPSMGCWDRSLFEQVNGYPMIQSGQDIGIDKKFMQLKERQVTPLKDEEVYYIYKFGGTHHPHLSSFGYDKGWHEIGKREIIKEGKIQLVPQWRQDYVKMVREAKHGDIRVSEIRVANDGRQ